MLRLPRLISNGCVLQQGEKTRIFGFADPGETVSVRLQDCLACGAADGSGRFDLYLSHLRPGGPFSMTVESGSGECLRLEEVYVGEVWLSSGQSNMELPMERVRDRYPGAIENSANPQIHMFQVSEHYDFEEALEDCQTGEWKAACPESVRDFSALSLFFTQFLQEHLRIPVGIINVSLGGSPIEAWMSREALEGEPEALKEADFWRVPGRIEKRQREDAAALNLWHQSLQAQDKGLPENGGGWMAPADDQNEPEEHAGERWKEISLPGFLKDRGLEDFVGSIWLKREFQVTEELAGTKAKLWLGTMVDSDETWINGVKVGQTPYQYPPRKYEIPEGLLKKGWNEVTVRLICENGHGRLTPDKEYRIFNERGSIDLKGSWKYRIGCRLETPAPEQTFISWMATGLYQGMLHPCQNYTVKGILWYQGESNDKRPDSYGRLLKKMIQSWRTQWRQEHLPFVVAQLPGFSIDLEEDNRWPKIRQAQKEAEELPDVAVTVNLDLGEKNDLHPTGKREVAYRMYRAALQTVYKEEVPCSGPVPVQIRTVAGTGAEPGTEKCETLRVQISFRLDPWEREKFLVTQDGMAPGEFELAGEDGVWHPAQAAIQGLEVELKCSEVQRPVQVRYGWRNAPDRGLLCSPCGFLAAPFTEKVMGH